MGASSRSVKVRFDGDASGVSRAARQGERDVDRFGKSVDRNSRSTVRASSSISASFAGMTARLTASSPKLAKALTNPYILAAGAAAGVVGGAAVAGAALAGTGAAIIGLGAVALKGKAQVVRAMTELGTETKATLQASAAGMELPLVRAVDRLTARVEDSGDELKGVFDGVTPSIENLSVGFDGLIKNALPGLIKLSEGAGKVLNMLSDELPELGSDVSDIGESLGEAADGGGKAFVDMLNVAAEGAKYAAGSIQFLAESYDFLDKKVQAKLGNPAADTFEGQEAALRKYIAAGMSLEEALAKVNAALNESKSGFYSHAASVQFDKAQVEAAERANYGLEGSLGALNTAALAAAGSEIAARDARRAAIKELQNGSRSLRENTVVGDENRMGLLRAISAAEAYGEREAANSGAIKGSTQAREIARAATQRHTDALYRDAIATGASKTEVDKLWRSLGLLPPSKSVKVSAPGAKQATAEVDAFNRAVSRIQRDRTFTLHHVTQYSVRGAVNNVTKRQIEAEEYNLGRRAAGGRAAAGRSYLVGENGPEILHMGNRSGYVSPNSQLGGDTYVYVTIDGQQLEGRIERVVRNSNRNLKRAVQAGAR